MSFLISLNKNDFQQIERNTNFWLVLGHHIYSHKLSVDMQSKYSRISKTLRASHPDDGGKRQLNAAKFEWRWKAQLFLWCNPGVI